MNANRSSKTSSPLPGADPGRSPFQIRQEASRQTMPAKEWAVAVAVIALLSACGKTGTETKPESAKPGETSTSTASKSSTEKTGDNAGESAGANKTAGTSPETGAGSTTTGAATGTGSEQTKSASGDSNASQPGNVSVNLADLPNDVPICTVAGNDIKVGDYKRMLRIQQTQANQAIVVDPSIKAKLIAEAKKLGIELTKEEKTRLVEAAHREKGQDPREFQEFLKKANATEQQFDEEVLQSGLAFKTSNALIEKTLLADLVNRELLAQAAQESGGEKDAMNKYLAFKHTKNFDALMKQTSLSADSLKEEMVKAELAKMQLSKLQSQAKVSEADLKKLYDSSKDQLKHGERIKLSTILIACPEKDLGPISSVRTQLQRANPKLSGKELDVAAAQYLEQAKQRALILLGEVQGKPDDFAKLANANSMDPMTQAKKNGGDMGLLEKKQIIPALGDAVFKLKPGQVLPQIVKSELGYNIYRVTAKEGAGVYKYEEVKPILEMQAKQAKLQQVLAQWMDQRRKVVRVEFTSKFREIASKSQSGKSMQ